MKKKQKKNSTIYITYIFSLFSFPLSLLSYFSSDKKNTTTTTTTTITTTTITSPSISPTIVATLRGHSRLQPRGQLSSCKMEGLGFFWFVSFSLFFGLSFSGLSLSDLSLSLSGLSLSLWSLSGLSLVSLWSLSGLSLSLSLSFPLLPHIIFFFFIFSFSFLI